MPPPSAAAPARRLVILTHPLAPYRMELYDRVQRTLGDGWTGTLIYGQDVPADHAWQHLLSQDYAFKTKHVPASCPPKWFHNLLKSLRLVRHPFVLPAIRAAQEVSRLAPSLIWIAEYSSYTIPTLLWAYVHRVPVIVSTEMGQGMPRIDFSWVAEAKHRLMGRLVKGQVASSPWAVRPCYPGIDKVVLCPHAVDTSRYIPISRPQSETPVFLYVGNVIHRKGIDLLFKACAALRQQGSAPFIVRLVGGGDLLWAKELVQTLGLDEIVDFAGFKEGADLIQTYQQSDCFVLPSRYDTYGAVAHEAASCGLPLLLSKHAGSSQIMIQPGENGFVIDPANSAEFASALKAILASSERRLQMGRASRALAETWSVQNSATKVVAMIEDLTNSKH